MSSIIFDVPVDTSMSYEQRLQQEALLQKARNLDEQIRLEREEDERKAKLPQSRAISIRMENQLINQIDFLATQAGTNRGHLIRQIVIDYLNYLKTNEIFFAGSLLSLNNKKLFQR